MTDGTRQPGSDAFEHAERISTKPQPGAAVYTMMGPELDESGQVKNGVKCDWATGAVFVTPPGWWHSHHNESVR